MYFIGIDIGAVSAKGVVVKDNHVLSRTVLDTGSNVERAADTVLQSLLKETQTTIKEVKRTVATGYGRNSVPFADMKMTEITCHARGVIHLMPEARTIIDVGGQDSKAIRVDEQGTVCDFVMNDKCAAGTGRFLEVMAKALELKSDDLGAIALSSKNPAAISSVCTVFAESEIVSLRGEGEKREDIVAGIHTAIASRINSMVMQIGCEDPVVLTGGVARNEGLVRALGKEMGRVVMVPEYPQLTGALGAALIAATDCEK
jgi:predicted CoA-substrate-specific enzyme activase